MKKTFLLYLFCISHLATSLSKVTIITPIAPNDPVKDFLHELTNQDFFSKMELIFISNENICQELQEINRQHYIFRNIRCINSYNHTISALFNQAIQESQGNFVTLMRPEDHRDPGTFKSQIMALENDPSIDVVYSDYHTSYNANTPTDRADNWYLNELPEFNPRWMYRDIPGPHAMWRKSLHEKSGYFKEDFFFQYLWEFWNRCVHQGAQFKKVHGKPGTYYFNYFNQKKILITEHDFAKSYEEEKYIRDNYEHLWTSVVLEEKPFVIITPSYNNKDWYKRNLDSTLNQNYNNYRIIYIDDCSRDNTGQLAQDYAKTIGKENKISIIINQENKGALFNIYHAIHSCKPEEICIICDGDDALAHNDVLKHLNSVYQDQNVWLTYGQFEWFPTRMPGLCFEVPHWVIEKNHIRKYRWCTSHLRTFYSGLFQKIKKEDLLFEGKFFPMAWDLGMMYPMIEMAGYHIRFIPEILYSYNTANQLNDNKTNLTFQDRVDKHIRNSQAYYPIANWKD